MVSPSTSCSRCCWPSRSALPLCIRIYIAVKVPLDELSVFALHDVGERVLGLLLVFVGVEHLFAERVDEQLALVDEDHLHGLVVQPEDDCVL